MAISQANRPILLDVPAGRLDSVLAQFSSVAGETLTADKAFSQTVVSIHLESASITDAKAKLAEVLGGHWGPDGKLVRSEDELKALKKRETDYLLSCAEHTIMSFKKLVKTLPTWTDKYLADYQKMTADYEKKVATAKEDQNIQDPLWKVIPPVRAELIRFVAKLSPRDLLAQMDRGRLVLSSQPTPLQSAMPGTLRTSITQALQLEAKIAKIILGPGARSENREPFSSFPLGAGYLDFSTLGKFNLAIRIDPTLLDIDLGLTIGDQTGLIVHNEQVDRNYLDRLEAGDMVEEDAAPVKAAAPAGSAVQLSDLEKFDPLELSPAKQIRSICTKQKVNSIMVLGDDAYTIVGEKTSSAAELEEDMDGSSHEYALKNGWLTVAPFLPLRNEKVRADRPTLLAYLRMQRTQTERKILEISRLAAKLPYPEENSLVQDLSTDVSSNDFDGLTWPVMKVIGSLTEAQYSVASTGGGILMRALTSTQRALVTKWVFIQDEFSSLEQSTDPRPAWFPKEAEDLEETIFSDPTERLPNGIADDALISLTLTSESGVSRPKTGRQESDDEDPLYRFMSARVVASDRLRFLKPDLFPSARKSVLEYGALQESKRATLGIVIQLEQGLKMQEEASNSLPASSQYLRYEDLPAAFRNEVEAQMKSLEALIRSRKNGGG